jgi:multidrug/hemolysin transport system permease protein
MPISTFSNGLQKVLSFLPGTYGTSLLRNHAMAGALQELKDSGLSEEGMTVLRDMLDCDLSFFDHEVSIYGMYAVLCGFTLAFFGVYVLANAMQIRKAK